MNPANAAGARLIVTGNEKGGSGKSTVAMHIAVALMKANRRVGTIDLDSRQKTFTHYVENRYAWAQDTGQNLEIPDHIYFVENADHPTPDDEIADGNALVEQIARLAERTDTIVIDTPGRDSYLGRLAHSMADVLVTPLNDSFVDLDVLGIIDRQCLTVIGTSHYAQMVQEVRAQRQLREQQNTDWIVMRNRLSALGSRNTRYVGEGIRELAQRLNFRSVDGLTERLIYREFYPRGLTALDSLDAKVLGTRPTDSHAAARREVAALLQAIGVQSANAAPTGSNQDAA